MPADAIISRTPGVSEASSWSLSNSADQLEHYANRAAEIRAWLVAHPDVQRFVIIDDRPSAADEVLAAHFVKTTSADGLTDADVERCRRILSADGPARPAM